MREFWTVPLEDLDREEWEALCDGCAKCCYIPGTSIPCRLLDGNRCSDYRKRFSRLTLEDGYRCRKVSIHYIESGRLPDSCAYVRRHRGEALEDWQIEKADGNYRRDQE